MKNLFSRSVVLVVLLTPSFLSAASAALVDVAPALPQTGVIEQVLSDEESFQADMQPLVDKYMAIKNAWSSADSSVWCVFKPSGTALEQVSLDKLFGLETSTTVTESKEEKENLVQLRKSQIRENDERLFELFIKRVVNAPGNVQMSYLQRVKALFLATPFCDEVSGVSGYLQFMLSVVSSVGSQKQGDTAFQLFLTHLEQDVASLEIPQKERSTASYRVKVMTEIKKYLPFAKYLVW